MRRLVVMSVLCVLAFGVTLQAKKRPSSNPIVGTWKCMAHGGPHGLVPFTLYLEQSAEGLAGVVSAPQGTADLTSVTFKHNRLKIHIDAQQNNYTLTATLVHGKLMGKWYRDGQERGTWEGKK